MGTAKTSQTKAASKAGRPAESSSANAPNGPGEASKQAEPSPPGASDQPNQPAEAHDAAESGKGNTPGGTDAANTQAEPSRPSESDQASESTEASTPAEPSQPGDASKPDESAATSQSEEPHHASTSSQPSDVRTSSQPSEVRPRDESSTTNQPAPSKQPAGSPASSRARPRGGAAARKRPPLWKRAAHLLAVAGGAAVLTALCFLVLPIIQSVTEPPKRESDIREVGIAQPPPPPPPEQEEPPEPEEEKPEPELKPEQKPLDLNQLDIALNAGTGGGLGGQLSFDIGSATDSDGGTDALFNLGDLDQRPRPVYRKMPNYTRDMRRNAPGEVVIIFIVNKNGRVEEAKVQQSSHPAFERAALSAIKQWKFEPGKRDGEPVRFRMKQPFKFPKT